MRNIALFRSSLLEGLHAEQTIELDLAAVEEADLSLPQLLTALRHAGAEAGRVVRLRAPAPAAVVGVLERAGFLADATADDLDFWFHGERLQ